MRRKRHAESEVRKTNLFKRCSVENEQERRAPHPVEHDADDDAIVLCCGCRTRDEGRFARPELVTPSGRECFACRYVDLDKVGVPIAVVRRAGVGVLVRERLEVEVEAREIEVDAGV